MTSRKNHIPGVTEQVFQMPFALWDGSHPFENVAQSVEKFILQSRQTESPFHDSPSLSGHKLGWPREISKAWMLCFLKGK